MDLKGLLHRMWRNIAEIPEFTEDDIENWQEWVRNNLNNLLEILSYSSTAFNLDEYMLNLAKRLAFRKYGDTQSDQVDNLLDDYSEALDLMPKRAPKIEDIEAYMKQATEKEYSNEVTALFLIYAYHLRRSKNRSDENVPPPAPNLPVPGPPLPPGSDPVVPDKAKKEEKKRENQRRQVVDMLRMYATYKVDWSREDRERAITIIKDQWKLLDGYSKQDLTTLYHECLAEYNI